MSNLSQVLFERSLKRQAGDDIHRTHDPATTRRECDRSGLGRGRIGEGLRPYEPQVPVEAYRGGVLSGSRIEVTDRD